MPPRFLIITLAAALALGACTAVPAPAAPTATVPVLMTQIVGTATALRLTASAPTLTPAANATSADTAPAGASPTLALPAATPIPSAATQPPPALADLPTWTPDPAATPVIVSFTIDPVYDVVPGGTLNLEWQTQNAVTVTLLHVQANGLLGGQGRAELPAAGRLALTTDERARNTQLFALTAYNAAGASFPTNIYVHFRCPYPYFFGPGPEACPDGPAVSKTVVEQPFEGGRLLWIPNEAGAIIFTLFADGQVYAWGDLWAPGQPESDPSLTPPAGRFQPVRGFGLFWRQTDWVRERLGWALAPERGYATEYQTEQGGVDSKGGSYFLRAADGRVIQITYHYVPTHWRYLE